MAIPYDKLVSWAKPGKNQNSRDTYAKLRQIIEENFDNVDIFLQGSYANSTNVRDNSDIDVVVVAKDYTTRTLAPFSDQKNLITLKEDLYKAINGKRNFKFVRGAKTIKYEGNSYNLVPADIIPACYFVKNGQQGIALFDAYKNQTIYNYPKQHKENGEEKSGNTNGNYKKTVRMFKNARNHIIDLKYIPDNLAPSYFIECLLYNVPDEYFDGNESNCMFNVLKWLFNHRNSLGGMVCQNGITNLFGNSSTQWNTSDAKLFIEKLVYLWDNWGKQ